MSVKFKYKLNWGPKWHQKKMSKIEGDPSKDQGDISLFPSAICIAGTIVAFLRLRYNVAESQCYIAIAYCFGIQPRIMKKECRVINNIVPKRRKE